MALEFLRLEQKRLLLVSIKQCRKRSSYKTESGVASYRANLYDAINSISKAVKPGTSSRLLFIISSIWLISAGIYEISGQNAKSKSWIGNTELVQMIVSSNGSLKIGIGISVLGLSAVGLSGLPQRTTLENKEEE